MRMGGYEDMRVGGYEDGRVGGDNTCVTTLPIRTIPL